MCIVCMYLYIYIHRYILSNYPTIQFGGLIILSHTVLTCPGAQTSSDSARRCAASRDARCLRMAEIKRPGATHGNPPYGSVKVDTPQKNSSSNGENSD